MRAASHAAPSFPSRHALARKEFELHYQPQYDTVQQRIVGVEALLRWRPANGDPVSPVKFIPVAEETGMIAGIGEWVLRAKGCDEVQGYYLSRPVTPDRIVELLRPSVGMTA